MPLGGNTRSRGADDFPDRRRSSYRTPAGPCGVVRPGRAILPAPLRPRPSWDRARVRTRVIEVVAGAVGLENPHPRAGGDLRNENEVSASVGLRPARAVDAWIRSRRACSAIDLEDLRARDRLLALPVDQSPLDRGQTDRARTRDASHQTQKREREQRSGVYRRSPHGGEIRPARQAIVQSGECRGRGGGEPKEEKGMSTFPKAWGLRAFGAFGAFGT